MALLSGGDQSTPDRLMRRQPRRRRNGLYVRVPACNADSRAVGVRQGRLCRDRNHHWRPHVIEMGNSEVPPVAQYDVIVVGVGGMGSAAVYQLARRGLRV